MPYTRRFQIEIFKNYRRHCNIIFGLRNFSELVPEGESQTTKWKDQFLAQDTAPKVSFINRSIRGNPRPKKANFRPQSRLTTMVPSLPCCKWYLTISVKGKSQMTSELRTKKGSSLQAWNSTTVSFYTKKLRRRPKLNSELIQLQEFPLKNNLKTTYPGSSCNSNLWFSGIIITWEKLLRNSLTECLYAKSLSSACVLQ